MKKTPKELKINKVEYLGEFKLKLLFSNDFVQIIDFENFLRNSNHPSIRKYLISKNFKKYTLKNGDLMWGDFELIFPVLDLYHNSIDSRAS
jgi:hypothetical protein